MFTAALSAPAFAQRIKVLALSGLLALSLMVGAAATATQVGAERVPPGFDSLTIACAGLQNHARDLAGQFHDASASRREDILAELRNINGVWVAAGCQAAFGGLLFARPDISPTGAPVRIVGSPARDLSTQ